MDTIATVRLLGGRPCLDLVNTVYARRDSWGPDFLTQYEDLITWSERVKLLGSEQIESIRSAARVDPQSADVAFETAKQLREAAAEVFSALVEKRPIPDSAFAFLGNEVVRARRHQRLTMTNERFDWTWEEERPLDRIAHRVALDAAAILTSEQLCPRVKLCTGRNCGWLFLDETKNGSRRWCRDEGCGAHMRVLRHRAKKS